MSEPSGALSASVLIADDEEIVRIGIRSVLLKHAPDWTYIAEAANVDEALENAEAIRPRVAIVDQCLPGGPELRRGEGVLELCGTLTRAGVGVVIYTQSGGTLLNRFFQRAGAIGTVGKNHAVTQLTRAVESAMRGDRFYAPPGDSASQTADFRVLTPRQAEIIRLLALGHNNPEIALECGMSVRTVESHRARIRHQIGADSLSELTRFALTHGLICGA